MLECSACIRRCIRALFANVFDSRPSSKFSRHRLPPRHHSQSAWIRRGYATESIPFENAPAQHPVLPTPYVGRSNRPTKPETPYKKKSLEEELRWLKDPLKLGDNTVDLLRKDEFQKALELVRLASKDIECTVSWNHLVDYEMSKGRVTNASKIYNEVIGYSSRESSHDTLLMLATDEEACPAARCSYVYYSPPWLRLARTTTTLCSSRTLLISLHVQ